MADCIDYNCDEGSLGTYHENDCGKEFSGGISQAVIFYCGHQLTDPTDGVAVLAEITAQRAQLVTGASFSIDDPQGQETESIVPCRPPSVTTYKRAGTYANPNVNSDNDDFHDILFSGKKFGGLLLYECQSNADGFPQCKWIDEVITFKGGLTVPGKTTDKQAYKGTFAWESLGNPKTVATPAGVFD